MVVSCEIEIDQNAQILQHNSYSECISFITILFFSFLFTYLRATAAGFSKLSERISHLEDALLLQHQMQVGGGAGPGDQNLPPEDEEEEEADYERRFAFV